jgi:hypothetical protein
MFDLQREIDTTTTGVIQLPYGEEVGRDNVTYVINRPCRIQGATMLTSRLRGRLRVTTREPVILADFRHIGAGSTGVVFDYAFRCKMDAVLSEGFDTSVHVLAGNSWSVQNCYFLGRKWGVEVRNQENADEGDWLLLNTTFSEPGKDGSAALHYVSSGGGRCIGNKILGYAYGFLAEIEGVTSDWLCSSNSIENYRNVGIAGRVQSGSFENVTLTGNQFAAGDAYAITMDGIHRGTATGNVANCRGPVVQLANAYKWNITGNQGNY